MSDKAEAAQKWAEAKAALDAADSAYDAAKEAYQKAEDAEFHAWQALEALAGRTSSLDKDIEPMALLNEEHPLVRQARGQGPDPMRHSLPQKPIG